MHFSAVVYFNFVPSSASMLESRSQRERTRRQTPGFLMGFLLPSCPGLRGRLGQLSARVCTGVPLDLSVFFQEMTCRFAFTAVESYGHLLLFAKTLQAVSNLDQFLGPDPVGDVITPLPGGKACGKNLKRFDLDLFPVGIDCGLFGHILLNHSLTPRCLQPQRGRGCGIQAPLQPTLLAVLKRGAKTTRTAAWARLHNSGPDHQMNTEDRPKEPV